MFRHLYPIPLHLALWMSDPQRCIWHLRCFSCSSRMHLVAARTPSYTLDVNVWSPSRECSTKNVAPVSRKAKFTSLKPHFDPSSTCSRQDYHKWRMCKWEKCPIINANGANRTHVRKGEKREMVPKSGMKEHIMCSLRNTANLGERTFESSRPWRAPHIRSHTAFCSSSRSIKPY